LKRTFIATAAALALCVATLLLSLPKTARAQEEIGISRGATPEPVQIETLEGESADLAAHLGAKPVLVEFWATWCENCEALQPRLTRAHERFGDRIAFYAVAVGVGQNPRSIRRHLRRHPVPYTVLWDSKGAAVRAFKTPATSYIVIVDDDGKVAYTGIGPDQDIEAAVREVLREK
jgi:thiol-disulfide isomerase/thioredoxin